MQRKRSLFTAAFAKGLTVSKDDAAGESKSARVVPIDDGAAKSETSSALLAPALP